MNDIYFDRQGGSDERAYTRIDFNRATVGNRWLERTWSGFFGTTNSLQVKGSDTEWVITQNPEFSLQVDGNTIVPMDLGEIDVSDACSDLGASLSIIKSGAGVEVSIVTTALHDVPALVRKVSVCNRGAEPILLESVSSEILAWEPEGIVFLSDQFRSEQPQTYQCAPDDASVAAMLDQHGVITGRLGDGEVHLHSPEPQQFQIVWPCQQTLAPMKTWTADLSYLIPCDGDPFDTYRLQYAQMVTQIKLAERQEEQKRKLLQEEADANISPSD